MTNTTWKGGNGDWNDAGLWTDGIPAETVNGGGIPTNTIDAIVPDPGGAGPIITYSTVNEIANTLFMPNGTLAISGGLLSFEHGSTVNFVSQSGGNLNFVDLTAGDTSSITGDYIQTAGELSENDGVLTLTGGGSFAGGLDGTAQGGGHIVFSGSTFYTLDNTTLQVAVLELASNSTIDLTTDISVPNALDADAGSLIELGGNTLTLTGSSSLAGTITDAGGIVADGPSITLSGNIGGSTIVVENQASLQVNGGLGIDGSDSVTNDAGATFGMAGELIFGTGTGTVTIDNAGKLVKNTDTNTGEIGVAFNTQGNSPRVINTGTIAVDSGTLAIDGVLIDTGTIAVTGSLVLNGTATLTGPIGGSGALVIRDGGITTLEPGVSLTTGSLGLFDTGTDLQLATDISYAGSVDFDEGFAFNQINLGSFDLTLSGPAGLHNNVEGSGTLTVGGTSDVTGIGLDGSVVVHNSGSIVQSGFANITDASTLINEAGGTYDILDDAAIGNTGTGAIVNAGLFEKTGSGGTSRIDASLASTGTLDIADGVIQLTSNGSFGGLVDGAGGLSLTSGAHTLEAGLTLTVATLSMTGIGSEMLLDGDISYAGTFDVDEGFAFNQVDLNGFNLTLSGPAALHNNFTGAGTLFVTGIANVDGLGLNNTVTLDNTGTLIQDSNSVLSDSAVIVNAAGGIFDFNGDGEINDPGPGPVSNAGLLEKTGGTGTTEIFTGLVNTGRVVGVSGVLVLNGAVTNNATIEAEGGSVIVSANPAGTGVLAIADGGTLRTVATGVGQTAEFLDSTGTLALDNPGAFSAAIENFDGGDIIDVNAVVTGTSYVGGVLNLLDNGGTVAALNLIGDYSGLVFNITPNGPSRSLLTVAAPCYAAGTRIATATGETRVEALRVGERVRSAFGGAVPVSWIGHRRVDCRKHPRPQEVWPIRVRAHAFGSGLPDCDLLLSPDHAVYVNEVLIPIRHLVNDTGIVQEPRDTVTYFHVELPAHDVILAEGLPAESYLDTGNRTAFTNGGPIVELVPDFASWRREAAACAPLVVSGPRLEAVRAGLSYQLATARRSHAASRNSGPNR